MIPILDITGAPPASGRELLRLLFCEETQGLEKAGKKTQGLEKVTIQASKFDLELHESTGD